MESGLDKVITYKGMLFKPILKLLKLMLATKYQLLKKIQVKVGCIV